MAIFIQNINRWTLKIASIHWKLIFEALLDWVYLDILGGEHVFSKAKTGIVTMTSPILSIVEGWGVLISINLQGVNVNWNDGERVVRLQMYQMISLNQKSNSILRFFQSLSQQIFPKLRNPMWKHAQFDWVYHISDCRQPGPLRDQSPTHPTSEPWVEIKRLKKKILGHGPGHVEQKPFNLWKPNIFPVGLPSFWSIFSTFCALSDPQKPPGSANDRTVEGQHIRGALSSSRTGPVQIFAAFVAGIAGIVVGSTTWWS